MNQHTSFVFIFSQTGTRFKHILSLSISLLSIICTSSAHHWRHLTEMAQSLRSRAVLRAAKVRHGHSFSASQVPCWNRWLLEVCIFSNHWSIFHGWIRESRVFHVEMLLASCFLHVHDGFFHDTSYCWGWGWGNPLDMTFKTQTCLEGLADVDDDDDDWCCFTTQATLEMVLQSKPWPNWLRQEMRSNWAGETGAVAIYRGCQSALPHERCDTKRQVLQKFAEEHVASEEAHLEAMENLVCQAAERSWMPATSFGWALGYLSTRIRGAHGMYVTTEAVESFVEEHYGDQIARCWAGNFRI